MPPCFLWNRLLPPPPLLLLPLLLRGRGQSSLREGAATQRGEFGQRISKRTFTLQWYSDDKQENRYCCTKVALRRKGNDDDEVE